MWSMIINFRRLESNLIRLLRLAAILLGFSAVSCAPETARSDLQVVEVTPGDLSTSGTSDMLTHVEDLVVSGDSVWVLNSNEPFFLIFDMEARPVAAWGERGGGPGEFGDPTALLRHPESGEVWAYDAARHQIRPIHPGGVESDRTIVPAPSARHLTSLDFAGMGPGRPWIELRPEGLMAAWSDPSIQGTSRIRQSVLVSSSPLGTDTVLDVARMRPEGLRNRSENASLFGPHPLWTLCPNETLAYWDQHRQSIELLDLAGRPISSTLLPPLEEQPITLERLAAMMFDREAQLAAPDARMDSSQLRRALESDLAGLGDQLSDVFPPYASLECDERGDPWIQLFDAQGSRMGRGDVWIHVGGGQLQHMRFPEAFNPFHFGENEVWGILLDSLDLALVTRLDLPAS